MGKSVKNRRDFFRTLSGTAEADAPAAGAEDVLFKRYARKALSGTRRYGGTEPVADEAAEPATSARVGTVTTGLAPYTGTWSAWEVAHLLRRTSFGVKKADVDSFLTGSISDAVDALCTVSAAVAAPSATPVNNYDTALFTDSGGILPGADWTGNNLPYTSTSSSNDGTTNSLRRGSLTAWQQGVWIANDLTIREKMVQFWHHFIPVNIYDVEGVSSNSTLTTYYYIKLLRENGLGNFKTLMKAIAKHPAMLAYLGGQFSTASAPNENFARELLELFTMGKVPTQNYTEDDIQAAAKIFSGWRLSSFKTAFTTPLAAQPYPVAFNSTYHNTSSKTFSSYFGSTTITGLTGSAGSGEFDTFFDLLFMQQDVTIARYLARRLYRFFVYYDIDANIETNVIEPLGDLLISNGWDMLPVVKTLLKSEHFFDAANRGVMIKPPVDFLIGAVRTLNIPTTSPTITTQNQYAVWQYYHNYARNNLEQGWLDVPNVSGWNAYYQSPTYYQNWINSNSIQRRASFLTGLVSGSLYAGGINMKLDPIAWVQQFPTATIQNPETLIDEMVKLLLPLDLAATYKTEIKEANLLAGQTDNFYWTTAWNNYAGTPTSTSYANIVRTRLRNLFTALLQLAEAQLM